MRGKELNVIRGMARLNPAEQACGECSRRRECSTLGSAPGSAELALKELSAYGSQQQQNSLLAWHQCTCLSAPGPILEA